MNNSIVLVSSIILIVIIVLSSIVFNMFLNVGQEQYIKIGAILPLTGQGTSDQGQASQEAIQLAIDQINERGGVNGKKLLMVIEDSQCQAQNAVTAIQKLINVDKVSLVIGDICDSATAAIIPIAEENKVVLVTPGSTSPKISDAGDYIFRFWFSEADLGGMAAKSAYDMGIRKMAIIHINNEWGVSQMNAVSESFQSLDGNITSIHAINPDDNDYRTPIIKAEEHEPEAYYIGTHPNGLVLSLRQMKELGIEKQVFSHGGLVGSTYTLGLGEGLLEGIIAPFVIVESSEQFRNGFREKYGKEPGITADSSYDILMVVAEIMKDGESSDEIKEGLYSVKDYHGASGIITVDENGDTHRPLSLHIVKDGVLVPLS